MWTEVVSGKKKSRGSKYPDTCGRGPSKHRNLVHLVSWLKFESHAQFNSVIQISNNWVLTKSGLVNQQQKMSMSHILTTLCSDPATGGIPYPDWSEARTIVEIKQGFKMPKPPADMSTKLCRFWF